MPIASCHPLGHFHLYQKQGRAYSKATVIAKSGTAMTAPLTNKIWRIDDEEQQMEDWQHYFLAFVLEIEYYSLFHAEFCVLTLIYASTLKKNKRDAKQHAARYKQGS